MKDQNGQETPLRYFFNKRVRALATWITSLITVRSKDERLDFDRARIDKILLVRATFRMGDSILATPAIYIFRSNFPHARIDFVGPVISKCLFQNLSIVQHYQIYQRPPKAAWAYVPLMKHIRATKYDLAIDVSCGKSALGAFIVGFSGARVRVGLRGRRDRWFNVRLDRPAETSKYKNLPVLVRSMGLPAQEVFPSLILSPDEKDKAKRQLRVAVMRRDPREPVIGIFVGGRRSIGKRWPKENFMQVITNLNMQCINLVVFVGPEEKDVIGYFKETLPRDVPLVFEPSTRIFAAWFRTALYLLRAIAARCIWPAHSESGQLELLSRNSTVIAGCLLQVSHESSIKPKVTLSGSWSKLALWSWKISSANEKSEELRMLSLTYPARLTAGSADGIFFSDGFFCGSYRA